MVVAKQQESATELDLNLTCANFSKSVCEALGELMMEIDHNGDGHIDFNARLSEILRVKSY